MDNGSESEGTRDSEAQQKALERVDQNLLICKDTGDREKVRFKGY